MGKPSHQRNYRIYRRNLSHLTLRGEQVKSKGEKYIADFLCENNIPYRYEDVVFLGKNEQPSLGRSYKPDFTIFYDDKKHRLEHWGIDEFDNRKAVAPEWSGTWDEYKEQMDWKRSFWRERNEPLIETSIRDQIHGRDRFEQILRQRLTEKGIPCTKLSDSEIFRKIIDAHRTTITRLFVQFIQKAKKKFWSPTDVKNKIGQFSPPDDRTKIFLKLATKVYEIYQERLHDNNLIDFDDLISRAIVTIEKSKGECEIHIGKGSNRRGISLNRIQHVMVDEYQDFSELFFRIIDSMKKFNPSMNVYAVGDDWQAINAFAGSDLQYFENFDQFFDDGISGTLLTNYRSASSIVAGGNRIMQGKGEPSKALDGNAGGAVNIEYIEDVWLQFPNKDKRDDGDARDDLKFFFKNQENDIDYGKFQSSRYLKRCYELVINDLSLSYLILNRTNRLPDGTTLQKFSDKLASCFARNQKPAVQRNVSVMTVHQSKGREADCVILLGAVKGRFPLIHPSASLFEVFGDTIDKTIDEERRLFYVACTRAKNALFILTEEKNETEFL